MDRPARSSARAGDGQFLREHMRAQRGSATPADRSARTPGLLGAHPTCRRACTHGLHLHPRPWGQSPFFARPSVAPRSGRATACAARSLHAARKAWPTPPATVRVNFSAEPAGPDGSAPRLESRRVVARPPPDRGARPAPADDAVRDQMHSREDALEDFLTLPPSPRKLLRRRSQASRPRPQLDASAPRVAADVDVGASGHTARVED